MMICIQFSDSCLIRIYYWSIISISFLISLHSNTCDLSNVDPTLFPKHDCHLTSMLKRSCDHSHITKSHLLDEVHYIIHMHNYLLTPFLIAFHFQACNKQHISLPQCQYHVIWFHNPESSTALSEYQKHTQYLFSSCQFLWRKSPLDC
jgi:methionine salvage enolase-phosphatase E1